jgi:hypothetical protein
MGMPAVIYRSYSGAHGLKDVTQNLALVGIKPRSSTLIGMIEAMSDNKYDAWLICLRELGRRRRLARSFFRTESVDMVCRDRRLDHWTKALQT